MSQDTWGAWANHLELCCHGSPLLVCYLGLQAGKTSGTHCISACILTAFALSVTAHALPQTCTHTNRRSFTSSWLLGRGAKAAREAGHCCWRASFAPPWQTDQGITLMQIYLPMRDGGCVSQLLPAVAVALQLWQQTLMSSGHLLPTLLWFQASNLALTSGLARAAAVACVIRAIIPAQTHMCTHMALQHV